MTAIPGETISQKKVLLRTRSAGVHHGILSSIEGTTAWVTDVRRIWRWRGAYTLNELSQHGLESSAGGFSRVSEPVPFNLLLEVCEVIPCSDAATKAIEECGWAK
jgi:hypothetical protein